MSKPSKSSTPSTKDKVFHRLEEEVNEEIHPILQKILDHIKEIGIAIGIIILIAASFTGYKYYKSITMENAKERVSQILTHNQGKEKIKALENYLSKAPSELKQAINLELATLCMKHQEYKKAAKHWEDIALSTEDINLRTIASLGQAKALQHQGQHSKALQVLEKIEQKAPQSYKQNIHLEIASVAEQTQDWEKALNAYQKLKAEADKAKVRENYLEYKIAQLQKKISKDNP